jgi:methylated-DNA-[protein]-cysteine S-methyltransferase
MSSHFHSQIDSPIGPLLLTCDEVGLTGVYMEGHRGAPSLPVESVQGHPTLEVSERQIREYFEGRRERFDLTLSQKGTPFQLAVWKALRAISFGATKSYSELARQVGRPKASRAVGVANSRNPISIIVPCHRVVGSSGDLTGYAGGLERKRWLLEWERRSNRPQQQEVRDVSR